MITSLRVRNFKSLVDFSIRFTGMNVLIGENGAGKTTVLQALDLLSHILHEDVNSYLDHLGWERKDILSAGTDSNRIEFGLEFLVSDVIWDWHLTLLFSGGEWKIIEESYRPRLDEETSEWIEYSDKKRVFRMRYKSHLTVDYFTETEKTSFIFRQSILTSITLVTGTNQLQDAVMHLFGIRYLGHLSPERMRRKSRGTPFDIGWEGEDLAAFLYRLEIKKREKVELELRKLIDQFGSLTTHNYEGVFGDVDFGMEQLIMLPGGEKLFEISSKHLSDGTLRILAVVALANIEKRHGIFLIDEIENGLNPHVAGKITEFLNQASEENDIQFILTSHSPLVVNYLEPENVVYLSRNAQGHTVASHLFEQDKFKESLRYMNLGEVWLNTDRAELEEAAAIGDGK